MGISVTTVQNNMGSPAIATTLNMTDELQATSMDDTPRVDAQRRLCNWQFAVAHREYSTGSSGQPEVPSAGWV